jgi:hypothetical protein
MSSKSKSSKRKRNTKQGSTTSHEERAIQVFKSTNIRSSQPHSESDNIFDNLETHSTDDTMDTSTNNICPRQSNPYIPSNDDSDTEPEVNLLQQYQEYIEVTTEVNPTIFDLSLSDHVPTTKLIGDIHQTNKHF